MLEGDKYVTLHMVWPTYLRLFSLLAENDDGLLSDIEDDTGLVCSMKRLGREYMNKNQVDFEPNFYHKAMTFLTPTMKKLNIISMPDRLKVHDDIKKYLKTHFIVESSTSNEISND